MASVGTTVPSARDPWATQLSIDEGDARFALAGLTMPLPGAVLNYRGGVFAAGSNYGTAAGLGSSSHGGMLVAPGSGLAVTVAPGNCQINTTLNGPYLCSLYDTTTLALAAASGTQNRYDLVIGRVLDDRNSSIASSSSDTNNRKFVVQVLTGDSATGTPVPPTSLLATIPGAIPLGQVYVAAGATTITAAAITDLRGPGLVARGARRVLFGADAKSTSTAFAEAGNFIGEQRYVVGHPFPSQTWWQSADTDLNGWFGDGQELVYTKNAPSGAQSWTRAQGTVRTIVSQTIPAFGVPVTITARGRLNCDAISPGVQVEARTRISGSSLISYAQANNFGGSDNNPGVIAIPGVTVGPFSSAVTIDMDALIRVAPTSTSGFAFTGNNTGQHLLQIVVKPANIDPIRIWL